MKGAVVRRKIAVLTLLTAVSTAAGRTQPLPSDAIRKLRFSRDGSYILAQDASNITVLTAKPLAVLFRIPAQDAIHAQFTPDSRSITFLRGGTRVDAARINLSNAGARLEYWSIAAGERTDTHELPTHACETEQHSPNGSTLACEDLFHTLWLVDTVSGSTILRKDDFGWNAYLKSQSAQSTVPPNPGFVDSRFSPDVRIVFSPDARYVIIAVQEHFIAGGHDLDRDEREWWSGLVFAWDLHLSSPVALKGRLNVLADSAVATALDENPDRRRFFTFVAPDRLLVSDLINAKNGHVTAMLMEFPSGRVISKPVLPAGAIFPAADPGLVMVRLASRNPNDRLQRTAATDLRTGEVIVIETPALDVLGRFYVAEPRRGWVGLYERRKGLQATIDLHKK